MSIRDWLGPPRPVVVTFAIVALVSTSVLGLLSWQLLENDRELDGPRLRGLVETAADEAVVTMTAALGRLDAVVSRQVAGEPPQRVSHVLTITPTGTTLHPPPACRLSQRDRRWARPTLSSSLTPPLSSSGKRA